MPAVPKYQKYLTWFTAVRILLLGIQLFVTTYNIVLNLANKVQILFGRVTDIRLTQTKGVVLSV